MVIPAEGSRLPPSRGRPTPPAGRGRAEHDGFTDQQPVGCRPGRGSGRVGPRRFVFVRRTQSDATETRKGSRPHDPRTNTNGADPSTPSRRLPGNSTRSPVEEMGRAVPAGDGTARVDGSTQIQAGEPVDSAGGVTGTALNPETGNAGTATPGSDNATREGEAARRTGPIADAPVGRAMSGRVADAPGDPTDGVVAGGLDRRGRVEVKAPGTIARAAANEPTQTGSKAVDSPAPTGRGQREPTTGDRQTGKTATAADTTSNQKRPHGMPERERSYRAHAATGQKRPTVAQLARIPGEGGAPDHPITAAATAPDPAPPQSPAPHPGRATGEYPRDNGMHALTVHDDPSKQPAAHRQTPSPPRRPPGREAPPGDALHPHPRSSERAAKPGPRTGAGSSTASPVIETQAGDAPAYTPTNATPTTDGQLPLETEPPHRGIRPATNAGSPAPRAGPAAQRQAMKQARGSLKPDSAQYREVAAPAQPGSDPDAATQYPSNRGARPTEAPKQPQHTPIPMEGQIVVTHAAVHGYSDRAPIPTIDQYEHTPPNPIDPAIPTAIGERTEITDPPTGQPAAHRQRCTDSTLGGVGISAPPLLK